MARDHMIMEETTGILTSLSTLSTPQLSDLTTSVLSAVNDHRRRLCTLLSSPTLFSISLGHLHSLSLPHKTLLLARHLLSSLALLTRYFHPRSSFSLLPHPTYSTVITTRDRDAVAILLLLCEVRQYNPEALNTSPAKWRLILRKIHSENLLTLSGIGLYNGSVLIPFIDMITRCRKFVSAVERSSGRKARKVSASPAAVVALPSVEVRHRGRECAICREKMRRGREVCELPCGHLFHWICILQWLRKTNTCPYCRFQLPSDDIFTEIQRHWDSLIKGESNMTDDPHHREPDTTADSEVDQRRFGRVGKVT